MIFKPNNKFYAYAAIFFAVSLFIGIAGSLYFLYVKEQIKKREHDSISSVAVLKSLQIRNWLDERDGDAVQVYENVILHKAIKKYMLAPDLPGNKEDMIKWLKISQHHNYQYKDIFLLDKDGEVLLYAGIDGQRKELVGKYPEIMIEKARKDKKIVFSDLYLEPVSKDIHLDILVPVLDPYGTSIDAFLLLRIDPSAFLYPLIQSWHGTSKSAETILIKKEGDDVLYLNELRHKKNTAFSMKLPLNDPNLPAAKALRGDMGSNEGIDYRGVPVIFAAEPVQGTSWVVLAQIDQGEVYKTINEVAIYTALIIMALIAVSGLITYQLWVEEVNVAERKLAEKKVRSLNEELEERVKKRTMQLELSNKELETFAYSVSHDLRAPLRAIDGFSAVIAEDYGTKLDDEGKSHLRRIRSAAQKMSELIDDLLNLSYLSRGELQRRDINLSEIVSRVVSDIRASEPDRDVDVSIPPDLHDEADPHLVEIVLTNLLNNAWKFTSKKDKAKIEFSSFEKDKNKVYYIKDNGAGFDMEYATKMFQPFQRMHTKEEFSGIGIGLATVYRIIKKHGGDIWAEGEVDKGATFYFTLRGG